MIVIFSIDKTKRRRRYAYTKGQENKAKMVTRPMTTRLPLPEYKPVNFNLAQKVKGLSPKQLQEHEQFYHGYVRKRNEIAQKLQTVDRNAANNPTDSVYRGLKIAQTYAMNGDILHRLYFENIGGENNKIGTLTRQFIDQCFGSIEAFKKDLYAAALSSRGWVMTAYTIDDGRIENYVLDAHNVTVPVMVMPILMLDVYAKVRTISY